MAKHVKGSAIANASSYKLYLADGTELATQSTNVSAGIDFDLSTIAALAAAGTYSLGVKAISGDTTKFLDSLMSNLVSYTVAEEPVTPTNYTFTINPDPTSANVTLSATGYSDVSGTGSQSITVANGTEVNWSVEADGYTTQEGTWTANGSNETENVVLVASGGETPSGEWLSVLLTGDSDAHNKFMNGTLTGAGSLAVGYDVIYTRTDIQSLLEGKKIYKFASNGLGENTITLYSNPYSGNVNTNTPEGRTVVGTVTSTSAYPVGTIVEYSVNNPSVIKDDETLSIGWTNAASGIKTVDGYVTPVYYLNGGVFKSAITTFCSFDFYVGE